MKLTQLQEAKYHYGGIVSQLLKQATEMYNTRKMLIKELQQLDQMHPIRDVHGNVVGDDYDDGDHEIDWDDQQNQSIVGQAALNANLPNFIRKLHGYPGNVSSAMLVKVLKELKKLV